MVPNNYYPQNVWNASMSRQKQNRATRQDINHDLANQTKYLINGPIIPHSSAQTSSWKLMRLGYKHKRNPTK